MLPGSAITEKLFTLSLCIDAEIKQPITRAPYIGRDRTDIPIPLYIKETFKKESPTLDLDVFPLLKFFKPSKVQYYYTVR